MARSEFDWAEHVVLPIICVAAFLLDAAIFVALVVAAIWAARWVGVL